MAKKVYYPKVVFPVGTAGFSYLNKPDTEGQYADNKFKTEVVFDEIPTMRMYADGAWTTVTAEQVVKKAIAVDGRKAQSQIRSFLVDGDEKLDKDGNPKEDYAGKYVINAKSKFKPAQVDTSREPLDESTSIYGGDRIKVSATALPYPPTGIIKGVALQLRAVQLVEKMNSRDAADDFDCGDDDAAGGETSSAGEPDVDDF